VLSKHYEFRKVKMTYILERREYLNYNHYVLLAASLANQQYFSLTPNQHQPTVIFSHNKLPPATGGSQATNIFP